MHSTSTLSTLRTRVRNLVVDAAGAQTLWADDTLDEGLRQALEEYSRASAERGASILPNYKIATLTPAANHRETNLATIADLLDVERVWFPYEISDPTQPPQWVDWELWSNAGAATLFFKTKGVPDGIQVARVFYRALHTVEDLDAATATTINELDAGLLCLGAAGFALFARSVDLAETAAQQAVATPNLAAIATRYLKQFRTMLAPRVCAYMGKLSYDHT